jgi:succinyl-diaminopimelate desuccinylase
MLSSGTAPNIVPAAAAATIDMRTADTGDLLLAWWQAQAELTSVDVILRLPALRTDPSDPWLNTLPVNVTAYPLALTTPRALSPRRRAGECPFNGGSTVGI